METQIIGQQYFDQQHRKDFLKVAKTFRTGIIKDDEFESLDTQLLSEVSFLTPWTVPFIRHLIKCDSAIMPQFQRLVDAEIVFREMQKNKPTIRIGTLWWMTSDALQYCRVSGAGVE